MQLSSPISPTFRTDDAQKKALAKLGLATLRDLLFYFPSRYANAGEAKQIAHLSAGETATIFGKVAKAGARKAWKSRRPIGEATIEDASGTIKVMWFNQAYMGKMIHIGDMVKLRGKISQSTSGLYMANPELDGANTIPEDKDSLFADDGEQQNEELLAVYPESRGISSAWLSHKIKKILASDALKEIEEYIPKDIITRYNLPSLAVALVWIHAPQKQSDAVAARKRFAFEEVFFVQLARQRERALFRSKTAFTITTNPKETRAFTSRFPFVPTTAQMNAVNTILDDLGRNHPMSRLLEGDVGSGKTMVAAIAAHAVVSNHPSENKYASLQVAYMAPTEILATQHFESFIRYFEHLNIPVGLITGSGAKKFPSKTDPRTWTSISKPQLIKWIADGQIPILFGTHTLIQKSVTFKHLALAIVDEQHRFGTAQRAKLAKKDGYAPHFLSMTATPIPRTLALTIYGDLDLTLIDEMPQGRKRIITEIIPPDERARAYAEMQREIDNGRQLYVICPRIDEADPKKFNAVVTKSVIAEAARLKKEVFKKETIGILHSKMTPKEKESVMRDFKNGAITILVATSVVEVGVNVPNATMIVIEGAERFGLAQLHQLRGRVVRSDHQAYCYIFSGTKSAHSLERLRALVKAKNGFELSELDLALRGAGGLAGDKQWGITDIGMEALRNPKLVEAARTEAIRIITDDMEMGTYPLLRDMFEKKKGDIHFE